MVLQTDAKHQRVESVDTIIKKNLEGDVINVLKYVYDHYVLHTVTDSKREICLAICYVFLK